MRNDPSTSLETVAIACKALAHPARLRIMQVLAERTCCTCGDVVDSLPLSQATVSQHLKVLGDAGLISASIDGTRSLYRVDAARLGELGTMFGTLFETLENCCRRGDDDEAVR
jgi:ArsR family transcriptional regulator